MGTMAKVSITRELEKIKKNNIYKQHFLYPILLQEDLYAIAYDRFMDETQYQKNNRTLGFNNEFNFLALKRSIKKLRRSNYSWISPDEFFDKFRIVQEILIIIFNFILTIGSESVIGETTEWDGNQSIHSPFLFIEDKIHESTTLLDITIPYSFHPEISIRTFREHISDTSFLHFFRLWIHQDKYINNLNLEFYFRKNQFYNLLWNFQVHKFEYSSIYICKQLSNFRSTLFWPFIDKKNFVQKVKYLYKQFDLELVEGILKKNCSIHYIRYRNNLVISANVNFYLFFKNRNVFLLIFQQKYFHFWVEPYRINIKDLSNNSLHFLGYISRIKNRSTVIRAQLMDNSIDTNLVTRELSSNVPIISLIGLLAKEKFCDPFGRPICKVSWTTLTDNEIFERFDQIMRHIFCYYSGCIRKKPLYQLQYILRFSRAKTLACKHKSTIRTVWKKYGSDLITNSISLKKPPLNSWRTYEKKFWYLNIIQINYLANLSQKLNNV